MFFAGFFTGIRQRNVRLQAGANRGLLSYVSEPNTLSIAMNKSSSASFLRLVVVALTALFALAGVVANAATATVVPGKKVTLSVSASGTVPFTYQWKKDGVSINGATASTYTIASTQTINAGAYTVVVSNSVGSTTSDIGTLKISAVAGDFNGDGKSDILWQNTYTGARSLWLMDGVNFSSAVTLAVIDPMWQIAAVADFNGDGKPDILWQNTYTGARSIWLMDGVNFSSAVTLAVIDPMWQIAAAADFNGDGKPDILWQNTYTGARSLWLMDGVDFSSAVTLAVIDPMWQIAH